MLTVVEPEACLATAAGNFSRVRRSCIRRRAPIGGIEGDGEGRHGPVPGRELTVERVPWCREAHHAMGSRLPGRGAEEQQQPQGVHRATVAHRGQSWGVWPGAAHRVMSTAAEALDL